MGVRIVKTPPVRFRTLDNMSEGRCFWAVATRDDNPDPDIPDDYLDPVYIPMCMGGAINGPEGCTCDHPLSEKEIEWKRKYRALMKEFKFQQVSLKWARMALQRAGLSPYPLSTELDALLATEPDDG